MFNVCPILSDKNKPHSMIVPRVHKVVQSVPSVVVMDDYESMRGSMTTL